MTDDTDPTDTCALCDELWHRFRTGDRNDLNELRLVHQAHVRLTEAEAKLDRVRALAELCQKKADDPQENWNADRDSRTAFYEFTAANRSFALRLRECLGEKP